ncbi:MAG: YoaP domain-containing protein [Candidatus Heimdallarchaeota archaeon]|nr:YoaP domain-containing protein [Candidatus Heimdallarchaeota archaeon]
MVIHCLWVVGQNKGKGYGSQLLSECLKDAEKFNGVTVLTNTKGHWLPKPALFKKYQFSVTDTLYSNFLLLTKKNNQDAPDPKFFPIKNGKDNQFAEGFTVFFSDQCPYNLGAAKFVKHYAEKNNYPVRIIPIQSSMEAQKNAFHPYGTYCVLFNGEYMTYYFQNEKEFDQLLQK